MKPKYSIGQTVKIKSTREKVKIDEDYGDFSEGRLYFADNYNCYFESELKPYTPSRTGKYRNAKGQFISKKKKPAIFTNFMGGINWIYEVDNLTLIKNPASKQRNDTKIDSKQLNYCKILAKLTALEKSIHAIEEKI